MRKLAAASTDLCFRRLGMYIAPYKQEAPHNSLTVDRVMSQLGPSHGRYICLKHRVTIFRPKWKVAVYRNLTACIALGHHVTAVISGGWSQLYLVDLEWSTDALQHTSGLQLRPQWEKLDRVHGHRERVTCCQPGLKWAKWTTVWAFWTPLGQNVLKVGKTFLEVSKRNLFMYLTGRRSCPDNLCSILLFL